MAASFGGSSGIGGYTIADDGSVIYADGSRGPARTAWQDGSGNIAYAANSAGPASTAGGAYQMPSTGGMQTTKPAAFGGSSGGAMAGMGSAFGGMSQTPAPNFSGLTGTTGMSSAGQNPYLQQMGDSLVQQNTQNLQRNVLPSIASQAMASGGYGGSRQGVIESNALSDLNTANAQGLASLYGNGFNTASQYDLGLRNNQLGYLNANNSYDLGLRNNATSQDLGLRNNALGFANLNANTGLGYANLDRNINNDNLAWQQQGANMGLGVYDRLQQGNQTGINAGTNIQNTPLNYWNQFTNTANGIGQGYGTTTGSASSQGSPVLGALGGAQLGGQVGNWWGKQSSTGSGSFDPFGMISF